MLSKFPIYCKMGRQRTVTSLSFKDKPLWFRFVNSAWNSSYFLGTEIKLDKDHLIKLARKRTGLHSFGDEFPEEPLDRLLDSINHEAELHPVGRFITRERLAGLLATRLRAENWFKKYPGILDQELYPVSLICGLQRTGTTKLHRLLAADPENRVLWSWEALNPVPLNDDPKEFARRMKTARISEKALRLMAPGFFSIHPVEYEKPEEDILLLDTAFLSTTPEATMHVPSYSQWLERTDQSYAYQYMVKLLKLLQYQRPAKRWVLKSPHHMEFLDLANRFFGRVHFIWTHRNILESLPSFISMMAHSQTIFSEKVSLDRVASHWVRKTGYMLSKGIGFRKANPGVEFTDLCFKDIVSSPMNVLGEIYQNKGAISPELYRKFLDAEHQNAPNRYGTHQYNMGDYKLNSGELNKTVSIYSDFLNTIGIKV
jgi:hypothetical protein